MKVKEFIYSPFFLSIALGILCWLFVFIITPVEPVFSLSSSALSYILLGYVCLFGGYLIFPDPKNPSIKTETLLNDRLIWGLILFVVISFLIRYYDLFVARGVSFSNTIKENRLLIDTHPAGGIFIIASVVRYLFFVPLIFLFQSKKKSRILLIICIALFAVPFIEGVIRGSRNSFFYPSILMFFILLYYKKIKLKPSHMGVMILGGVVLFLIATSILKKREISKETDYKLLTSKAIYNDFLKPKESVLESIHSSKSSLTKQILISGLQTGQYYTHGLFEFDNLMKTYNERADLTHQYGKFNFFNYIKLTNKYGVTDKDLMKIQTANPRGYSFVTFFGGLYIDFGWFGLLVLFLMGAVQKYVFQKVKSNRVEFLPLFLFFLFINFFMLTFNFLRGTGVNIITINILLILLINLKNSNFVKRILRN